jgi:uncharacterized protein YkwD
MTLVARPKAPAYHKKVSGNHHRQSKAYHKPYWPYLPLIAVVAAGFLLNTTLPGKSSVLGYSTDMSVQSLLNDTNAQRTSDKEVKLSLNTTLDTAAQNKANDMATRDYWSHDTPDGKTPWTFMTAAGYNYQVAGENLAYGFATASDTITGWMNSPEHRANILDSDYKDVGFGIINVKNYQNSGPETLVVAMYAAPATAAAAIIPTQTAPVSTALVSEEPVPIVASTPSSSTSTDTLTPGTIAQTPASIISEPKAQDVSRVQVLTDGKAPWSMFILSLLGSVALIIFLLRHGFAWHKTLRKGERFALAHPVLDVVLVGVVTLAIVLAHGSGVIR